MAPSDRKVLSASRRTDIPAFYIEWFMARIKRGAFDLVNPYNGRRRVFEANPSTVHSIVFWSKNYHDLLKWSCGETLQQAGYNLFFHFSINSAAPDLEPAVPPLETRLEQLSELCARFGPDCITWRFDPICHYRRKGATPLRDNLGDFEAIAAVAGKSGIQRCVTSFVDLYGKAVRRAGTQGLEFVNPPMERQRRVLDGMTARLEGSGVALTTCCERQMQGRESGHDNLAAGACIDHDLLSHLFGEGLSFKRDRGQRVKQGCGCHVSVDVGDYRRHPCGHGCLFCYANPVSQPVKRSKSRRVKKSKRLKVRKISAIG